MFCANKFFLLSGLILLSFFANSSNTITDITIFALKHATGSVWNSSKDKPEYLVSYNVTVSNNSNNTISPDKKNKMCFYLEGEQGQVLKGYGVQRELLSPYKPGESRDGIVYFSSLNKDLINLSYVKIGLGETCLKSNAQ